MAFKATAGHAQHKLPLYFFASPHTAEAVDAFAHIAGHVGMAEVFFAVEVCFAFRIANLAYAHLGGHFLQFAVVVYLTGKAIQRMIGEHQLNDVLSEFLNALTARIDIASGHYRCVTAGYAFAISILR